MKRAAILFGLAVAGCHQARPEVVKVPIPIACQTKTPDRPEYPKVEDADGLFTRVQKLLSERELRTGYEGQLEAAFASCK